MAASPKRSTLSCASIHRLGARILGIASGSCETRPHDEPTGPVRVLAVSCFANHEYTPSKALKPQDLLVALKLWVGRDRIWGYPLLARSLGISVSEAHGAVNRAIAAGLLPPGGLRVRPRAEALREFPVHGTKYSFPALRGELARGIPAARAAPALKGHLAESSEPPPVCPHAMGTVRGPSLSPLIPSAPGAALEDRALYELLALFDTLRAGRAREREMATRLLEERLR